MIFEPILLQDQAPATEEAQALQIVAVIMALLFLAGAAAFAVWLDRDARRRGAARALWSTLGYANVVLGAAILAAGFRAGHWSEAGIGSISWTLIGLLGLVLLWFTTRPHRVVRDAEGRPIHPAALPPSPYEFVRGLPPPSEMWTPAPAAKAATRCPRCDLVFQTEGPAAGPRRVLCPRCGLSGTMDAAATF